MDPAGRLHWWMIVFPFLSLPTVIFPLWGKMLGLSWSAMCTGSVHMKLHGVNKGREYLCCFHCFMATLLKSYIGKSDPTLSNILCWRTGGHKARERPHPICYSGKNSNALPRGLEIMWYFVLLCYFLVSSYLMCLEWVLCSRWKIDRVKELLSCFLTVVFCLDIAHWWFNHSELHLPCDNFELLQTYWENVYNWKLHYVILKEYCYRYYVLKIMENLYYNIYKKVIIWVICVSYGHLYSGIELSH